jgi:hypothetical protein
MYLDTQRLRTVKAIQKSKQSSVLRLGSVVRKVGDQSRDVSFTSVETVRQQLEQAFNLGACGEPLRADVLEKHVVLYLQRVDNFFDLAAGLPRRDHELSYRARET